ncbi:glutamine synthetase [Gammaproteobacteria bacterium LSUCC0057]|uniref:Glutamine synthetase n=1 Tax=Gammaproteobacteria bacterium LSUCC0057 TaxID=2559237 RepID=A0A4Y8UJ85_9GAMM|nr:glutamine synthetase [Gammaproteobacteria bacterium LSUCC0057]
MSETSTLPTALQTLLQQYPDIEVFEVILHDFAGNHRGKWVPREQIEKLFSGDFKMPKSVISVDAWGRDIPELIEATGDSDGICIADPATLAPVPWAERPTAQVVMQMSSASSNGEPLTPYPADPRAVLQAVVARYRALGLTPVVASELEFHLLQNQRDGYGQPLHTQSTELELPLGGDSYSLDAMREVAPIMDEIDQMARLQGIPVDTLITECGASQYEINLHHVADAVSACDHGSLLRRAIRAVARRHHQLATFMAKPFAEEVGNGMHIHFSLLDSTGNNVFVGTDDRGSDLLRHAVAGCLATMGDAMAIFAPNINSYRRLAPGSFAPVTANWGYENRTTALRIPAGDAESIRIEHRLPGADANVYLVVAAILAGALYGIEQQLEPSAAVEGEAAQQPSTLPLHWHEALNAFEQSAFIKEYLGAPFAELYAACKRGEKSEFDRRVTRLEYDAYL